MADPAPARESSRCSPRAAGRLFAGLFWFSLKCFFVLFFYLWIRATYPRYRYDQLMRIGWKVLIPLALGNVVVTAIA
jgi:NADH-quinone oxidoreductase subunit H